MAIFESNQFSIDNRDERTSRLQALKTYINDHAESIALPQSLTDWALNAYDEWTRLLSLSGIERGEAAEARQNMTEADSKTFSYCMKCRKLLKNRYDNNDNLLNVYGISGEFATKRNAKIKSVQDLLDGHSRLKAEGDPNILPEAFIEKLQTYYDESNECYATLLIKELPEAGKASQNQKAAFNIDTKKLRTLYNWTLMTWSKYDPFLVQLGFAPKIKRRSGGQPEVPATFIYEWNESELKLSWDECEKASSYQLAFCEVKNVWEELYEGRQNSFSYTASGGKRKFRVRARNANGFSEWSGEIEFERPQ